MVTGNIGSRFLTKDGESILDTANDLFRSYPSVYVLERGWNKGQEFSRVVDWG